MTDNNGNNTCFMCKWVGKLYLIPQTNVHLCIPCFEELDDIWESY